jgi:hypothetical protein
MNNAKLTDQEAFSTMFVFLEKIFEEGRFTELGALLGSMSLLSDGRPADPGLWEEWLEAIADAKERSPRLQLE